MKRIIEMLCVVALAGALPAAAQAPAKPAEPAKKADAPAIKYEAPKRGAPKGRIGGGTRGLEPRELTLAVIAPDHPGMSSVPAPKLYWFVSQAINATFEVSLMEEGADDAALDKRIPAPTKPGVQVLDLRALGIALKPSKEYRWFISLVSDPNSRSGDKVAGGKVVWEPLPADLKAEVDRADPASRAALYASRGYWYDAYAELRALRERDPGDPAMRETEASLVSQVGLPDVARQIAAP